jgi:hypothetical protein
VRAGTVVIEFISHREALERFGSTLPQASGRTDFIAAVSLRTSALADTEGFLKQNKVRSLRFNQGDVLVLPATETMNVTLEFTE